MTAAFDPVYREAFTAKLVEAMFEVSAQEVDGERIHFIRAAELIDAMVTNIAILMRDSEASATPSRTRQYCDELARKLQRRIAYPHQPDARDRETSREAAEAVAPASTILRARALDEIERSNGLTADDVAPAGWECPSSLSAHASPNWPGWAKSGTAEPAAATPAVAARSCGPQSIPAV